MLSILGVAPGGHDTPQELEVFGGVVAGGHVFVSYAHADSMYMQRLVAWLRGEGLPVWFNEHLPNSLRWDRVLEERIDSCSAVVAIMSPAARESHWVGVELDHARRRHKPIFPLLLEGEPLFGLGVIQYESVQGGRMPSAAFVEQLRSPPELSNGDESRTFRNASGVRQVGVVPNAADCFQQRPVAEALDRALTEHGSAIVTQILSGLGGVGKTQLAASAVRQLVARGAVDDVVWVNATTQDAVVATLSDAGVMLAGALDVGPAAAARRFLAWLATTPRRWLIVFDDVSDPNDLTEWWPPTSASGRVLVTTRRRDDALWRHGQLVVVEQFTPAEAHAYLTAKFPDQPHRLVQDEELAADLGYLPVALAQAAAYIADRNLTCVQYRQRLAAHPLTALAPDAWPDAYARSVAVTLSLAVDAADQLTPIGLAKPLLTMLSLLDPNGIPEQVITTRALVDYLAGQTSTAVDAEQAHDALGCLARLNLVTTTDFYVSLPAGGQVRVHALVQRAARDQARPGQVAAAATAAADALVQLWPDVERDTEFAKHLRANTNALRHCADDQLWASDGHILLFRAGRSLGEAGLAAGARRYFEQLAAEAEARLGRDHPTTLSSRSRAARWRGTNGDPAGAAGAFEDLVPEFLRVLGPDHPDSLIARGELARWRGEAGDPGGAATSYEVLLADRTRALGPDHPDTLTARHGVAYWSARAGNPARAAVEFEGLVADRTRVLGPDHPDTLSARSNLARWQGEAGDPGGAAAAYQELLADRTRVLGPDHPDTLLTRSRLAQLEGRRGDPAGAAAALRELVADRTRVLGPDHRSTLIARSNLARWQGEAGDAAGAAAAYDELLVDRTRLLGANHPKTLTTRRSLAEWRGEAGDPAGAAAALETLMADCSRVLGPEHPDSLTTSRSLARWQARAETAAANTDGASIRSHEPSSGGRQKAPES